MSDRIVYLKPPEQPTTVAAAAPAVIVGRRYQPSQGNAPEDLHGLCGGLDYNTCHGRVLPPSHQDCYLWDIDEELTAEDLELNSPDGVTLTLTPTTNILTSQFVLSHGTLSEPQIIEQDTAPQLTTTASFEFVISTTMQTVCLGLLNLVETQRFAILKNGERHSILDSGEARPVLYLSDAIENSDAIIPVLETGAAMQTTQHRHELSLAQVIPEQLASCEIENLTVLEQYTSFFMQRELPFTQENIWTPVSAPISWGWSMRVTRRHDGDWCIVRQKLFMPTVGHNGLELPEWEANQLGR